MFDLFLMFHYYGHQSVCSPCRKNLKKVYRRFISVEGAFEEMVLKIEKNNIKIIIAENWDVWPIFIF